MVHLTPLGPEFESIIAATVLFLVGGVLSFICCFCITNSYLWHKRRIYRRRLRHEWREGTDSTSTTEIIEHEYTQKALPKGYVIGAMPLMQPQLKRVIVVEKNGKQQQGNAEGGGGRRPSALKQGQRQHQNSNNHHEHHQQNQQKRGGTGPTSARNGNGKVVFECGTSTESTNSS